MSAMRMQGFGGRVAASVLALLLAMPSVPALAAPSSGKIGQTPPFRDALRTSVYGNYMAGLIANGAHDVAAASVFWRAALKHEPRNASILEKAFVASLTNGDMDEAFSLAERVVQTDKGNRMARLALAVRAARDKHFASARTQLMAAANPMGDVASVLMLGWSRQGTGKTDEAVKTIEKLGDRDWFQLYKTYHQGLIYDVAGQSARAGAKFAAAYQLNSSFLRAVDAYGRWLARNKSPEEGRAIYSAFAKAVMVHPMAERMQAEIIAGKPVPPLVSTVQQGMAEGLFGLGTALSRQEGVEGQSIAYLQLALALLPDFDIALYSLGETLDLIKQHERAIDTFRRVAATSPLKRNADMQIALSLEALEQHDAAIAQLQGLIADNPKDIEAVQLLGSVYRTRKAFKEAAEAYGKAIDAIETPLPQHWALFYFRGVAFERLKEWPKAEADFKKALELVPETNGIGKAQVLNYLGYSWIDQGINLEEGLKFIKRAVELQPDSGYIVDSLGWAYYRMGDYDKAVVELERAIELKPDDPVLNDHLGDAYWKVGRRTEARFQWAHARDYKPELDELIKVEAKLRDGLDGPPEPPAIVIPPPDITTPPPDNVPALPAEAVPPPPFADPKAN